MKTYHINIVSFPASSLLSDGGWLWCRHWHGKVLQH